MRERFPEVDPMVFELPSDPIIIKQLRRVSRTRRWMREKVKGRQMKVKTKGKERQFLIRQSPS